MVVVEEEEAAAVVVVEEEQQQKEESVFWRCHFGGVWVRTKETCMVMTEEEFLSGEEKKKDVRNCINTYCCHLSYNPPLEDM